MASLLEEARKAVKVAVGEEAGGYMHAVVGAASPSAAGRFKSDVKTSVTDRFKKAVDTTKKTVTDRFKGTGGKDGGKKSFALSKSPVRAQKQLIVSAAKTAKSAVKTGNLAVKMGTRHQPKVTKVHGAVVLGAVLAASAKKRPFVKRVPVMAAAHRPATGYDDIRNPRQVIVSVMGRAGSDVYNSVDKVIVRRGSGKMWIPAWNKNDHMYEKPSRIDVYLTGGVVKTYSVETKNAINTASVFGGTVARLEVVDTAVGDEGFGNDGEFEIEDQWVIESPPVDDIPVPDYNAVVSGEYDVLGADVMVGWDHREPPFNAVAAEHATAVGAVPAGKPRLTLATLTAATKAKLTPKQRAAVQKHEAANAKANASAVALTKKGQIAIKKGQELKKLVKTQVAKIRAMRLGKTVMAGDYVVGNLHPAKSNFESIIRLNGEIIGEVPSPPDNAVMNGEYDVLGSEWEIAGDFFNIMGEVIGADKNGRQIGDPGYDAKSDKESWNYEGGGKDTTGDTGYEGPGSPDPANENYDPQLDPLINPSAGAAPPAAPSLSTPISTVPSDAVIYKGDNAWPDGDFGSYSVFYNPDGSLRPENPLTGKNVHGFVWGWHNAPMQNLRPARWVWRGGGDWSGSDNWDDQLGDSAKDGSTVDTLSRAGTRASGEQIPFGPSGVKLTYDNAIRSYGPLVGNPKSKFKDLRYASASKEWFWYPQEAPEWAVAEIKRAAELIRREEEKVKIDEENARRAAAKLEADKQAAEDARVQAEMALAQQQEDVAAAIAKSQLTTADAATQSELDKAQFQLEQQAQQQYLDLAKMQQEFQIEAAKAQLAWFQKTGEVPLDTADYGQFGDGGQGEVDDDTYLDARGVPTPTHRADDSVVSEVEMPAEEAG